MTDVLAMLNLSIGKRVEGLGEIKEIFNNNGSYQFNIDGQFYHEKVVFSAVVRTLSFSKLEKFCLMSFEQLEGFFPLIEAAYSFIVTDTAREKFKKHDKRIFSKFTWLKSNLCVAYSKFLNGK